MRAADLSCWVKWLTTRGGAEVGEVERLPVVIASVYLERHDAELIDPKSLPAEERRRGRAPA